MYSDYIAKQENDDNQKKRATYKNETIYKANNTKDKKEKNVLNASVRSADLADMIREKYNISLNAGSDDEITSYFIEQVDN
jgi:DNA-directed RNA polymerase specialized sigma54-like protein